jgi:hypothetical protein
MEENREDSTLVAMDLSGVDARLQALESKALDTNTNSAAEPDENQLSDLTLRLDELSARLDAVNNTDDASPSEDMLSEVSTRLELLESQIADMKSSIAGQLDPVSVENRMSDIEARITSVEQGPEIQTLPPFPRQDVLTAVADARAQENKSWLGRVLDTQITITDDEIIAKLDTIETLLRGQNFDAALNEIGSLPDAGQRAADDWVMTLKDYRSQND